MYLYFPRDPKLFLHLGRAKSGGPFKTDFSSDDVGIRKRKSGNDPERIRYGKVGSRRRGDEGDGREVALRGDDLEQHEKERETESGAKILPTCGKQSFHIKLT